jgi:hypothetical protein
MSWKKCIERPRIGDWIRPCAPEYEGKGQPMKIVHSCFLTEGAIPGGEVLSRWEVWLGLGDPPKPHERQP